MAYGLTTLTPSRAEEAATQPQCLVPSLLASECCLNCRCRMQHTNSRLGLGFKLDGWAVLAPYSGPISTASEACERG
jgi:hypothetical protein